MEKTINIQQNLFQKESRHQHWHQNYAEECLFSIFHIPLPWLDAANLQATLTSKFFNLEVKSLLSCQNNHEYFTVSTILLLASYRISNIFILFLPFITPDIYNETKPRLSVCCGCLSELYANLFPKEYLYSCIKNLSKNRNLQSENILQLLIVSTSNSLYSLCVHTLTSA